MDKAGGLWGWRSMRKHFYIFFHSFASIWGWTRAFRGEKKAGFLGTESKERGRERERERERVLKYVQEQERVWQSLEKKTRRKEMSNSDLRDEGDTQSLHLHFMTILIEPILNLWFSIFSKKKKKKIMIFNILLCEVAVTVSVLIHSQWSFKSFFTSLSLCIDSQIVIFGVLNETFRIFFFNEETFRIWQPQVWLTSYFFNQRFFFILNKQ